MIKFKKYKTSSQKKTPVNKVNGKGYFIYLLAKAKKNFPSYKVCSVFFTCANIDEFYVFEKYGNR